MSPLFTRLLVAICIVLLPGTLAAAVVDDLYQTEVSVEDHSQRALTIASRQALSEVLVKVCGSTEVLGNPAIASELSRARNYVQQYSYTRDQDAQGDITALFEFDKSLVSRLVTESGAPLWTATRPEVLVWMVAQEGGSKSFVNWDLNPEVLEAVQQDFSRRGVPVQLPLFDLQDTAALGVEDVWRLQASPLYAASHRYGVQHVLAGRFSKLSSGQWVGDWTYLSDITRVDRSVSLGPLDMFLGEGVALVAEEMAGRYAVAASGADHSGIVMSVAGVDSYQDYGEIVAWLEGLELIEHANVELIRGDEIQLRLIAQAEAAQLRPIIELNKRLLPLSSVVGDDQLIYQWQN